MNKVPFNITTMRPAADMFVGKVTITENFTYEAETAFDALRIFMMIHTRDYMKQRACLLGIRIELATPALEKPPTIQIG